MTGDTKQDEFRTQEMSETETQNLQTQSRIFTPTHTHKYEHTDLKDDPENREFF